MKVAIKLCDAYRKEKRGWHASSRIRGHWLAKYWDELDDIFYPDYFKMEYNEFFKTETQLKLLEGYDAIIIHKAYENELIKELHDRGQKIIIDLSDPDYLLGFSNVGRAGQCLLSLHNSDAAVVNSVLLKHYLREGYDKQIFIIPDRIDPEIIEPRKIETLVWFGHSDNAESLRPLLPKLKKYKVKVISDKPIDGTEFVRYDPETINQEIKKADAVFLGERLNPFKSENRWQLARALNMPIVTIDDLDMSILTSVEQWKQLLTKI